MTWYRVDDQSAWNAKVLDAGNEAWGVLTRMGAHSCAQLTDGFIAAGVAIMIAQRQDVLDRLVEVGMLEPSKGGFVIHDFLEFNPSSEEIRSKRETERTRKEAMRKSQGRAPNGRITSARNPDGRGADSESRPTGPDPVPSRPVPIPGEINPAGGGGEAPQPETASSPKLSLVVDVSTRRRNDVVLVEHFLDGVGSTGIGQSMPFGAPLRALGEAIDIRVGPADTEPLRAARALGVRFLVYCDGAPDSAFKAIEWLNRGAPPTRTPTRPLARHEIRQAMPIDAPWARDDWQGVKEASS